MRALYLFAFTLLIVASCKKSDNNGDGCITETKRSYNLNAADVAAANQLLTANGIAHTDLAYMKIELHDTITNRNTNVRSEYQNIRALQYANGLPIFWGDVIYIFKAGVLSSNAGRKYDNISLNTSRRLNLAQLRELFISASGPNSRWKDSCLSAEFGYYDLNAGTNIATQNIVKAWSVTPAKYGYPQAFFRDDNGATISYFDGILY